MHQNIVEPAPEGMTVSNFLFHPYLTAESSNDMPFMLPPPAQGDKLFETAYIYIQGRYTLVDWVQARKWHEQREYICYPTNSIETTGAAGMVFARSFQADNLTSVQGASLFGCCTH